MDKFTNISAIIPVYKNIKAFEESFTHNYQYLKKCKIIIVNDSPTVDLNYLKEKYQAISLINNPRNLGFSGSVNKGVKNANSEYLLFLNSDVFLKSDNYLNSLNHFKTNDKLFAVGFAQINKKEQISGGNSAQFIKGLLVHKHVDRKEYEPNFWTEAGAMICRKDYFLKLNGFNDIYNPFYWEDVDLSYRAWKTGLEVYFDPKIEVLHNHETTITKYFSNKKIKSTAYRNSFLFHWLNIRDKDLRKQHLLFLLRVIPRSIFTDLPMFLGFLKACTKKLLFFSPSKENDLLLSDKEVLRKFQDE